VARYADYVAARLAEGHRLPQMLRHVQGLYMGIAGARSWRRFLGEQARRPDADERVLHESLPLVERAA
jgi:tRNA-dihydrouridine synthase A